MIKANMRSPKGSKNTKKKMSSTSPCFKGKSEHAVAKGTAIRNCLQDVTKPYESIKLEAMDVTKPYKSIKLEAVDVTKPYENKHL